MQFALNVPRWPNAGHWLAGLGVAAVVLVAMVPATPRADVGSVVLAPHRAVYDLSLHRTGSGSSVTDVAGRMVYELVGSSCAGFTQTMRFVMQSSSNEGQDNLIDMRSTSSEDAAGRTFKFATSQYRNQKRAEGTEGEATRGDPIRLELTRPEKKSTTIGASAYFPIQHSIELIRRARAGDKIFEADLYDGGDKGEKVYATVSLIGPKREGANKTLTKIDGTTPLDSLPAWPVTMSYYELASAKQDATPSYEMSYLFFDNGVSRRIIIDYGEFAVRATLSKIEFLEPAKCAPAK
ncbi:MAG TPA: cell envelope integrity EipB family protein [Hyphomicrobiaceae bacterium]|nr:cell envelope integrity EipB family protein [Hyphomicrobiaceae bacterium]